MDMIGLLVDVDGNSDIDWQTVLETRDLPVSLAAASPMEVAPMLETGNVVMMVLFVRSNKKEALNLLEIFRKKIGAIPHFQGIVCSDPDPFFMSDVFEFGIETFFKEENWIEEIIQFAQGIGKIMADENSAEFQTIHLHQVISRGDHKEIRKAGDVLSASRDHDFMAAYSLGNALEAMGDYNGAASAFASSQKLNRFFRPAETSLAENLLVSGHAEEALAVYGNLERLNPRNVARKAAMVSAYLENGDVEKAEELMDSAKKMDASHPKLKEAAVQILLFRGKVGDAFQLMDQLDDVGPLFAAKINEMGIKLSKMGKGKSAIALYARAHKIVKKELKYKISLNAALACYRLSEFQKALEFLDRAELELGHPYEKIEKIRKASILGLKNNRGQSTG